MPKKSKQQAMDILLRAVMHPTEEHVAAALGHSELKKALDGLDQKDFQSIAKVVSPYLLLKNGLMDPTPQNIASLTAHDLLGDVTAKLSPGDLQALGRLMKATASRSRCGNQVCR